MAIGTPPAAADDEGGPPVTAHTSAPDRTVLVERGNADAWIASDRVVDLGP